MTIYHYHDELTAANIKSERVYRLTIVYNFNSKEQGKTHVHYFVKANGALLVNLMSALIIDIFDIKRIEITRE